MTHSDTATQPRLSTGSDTNRLLELARRSLDAEVTLWREGEGGAFAEACQKVLVGDTTLEEPGFLGVPVEGCVLCAYVPGRSWSVEDVETLELIASLVEGDLEPARTQSDAHARAEAKKLRDAELRLALSASEMGVWNWDMRSDFVTTGAAFKTVWGFSQQPDKMLAQTVFNRVHPDDLPLMQAAIDKSVRDGVPYNLEFRVRDEDGSERWLVGRGEVIRNETGEAVKMLGVNFDITERQEAKEAAEQQAAILSLAHDPMIVWSETEGITTWSRGAQDLYGYSEAEVLGKETHSLLKTQHSASWETILATMRREGEWRRCAGTHHQSRQKAHYRNVAISSLRRVVLSGSWKLITMSPRNCACAFVSSSLPAS